MECPSGSLQLTKTLVHGPGLGAHVWVSRLALLGLRRFGHLECELHRLHPQQTLSNLCVGSFAVGNKVQETGGGWTTKHQAAWNMLS